MPDLTDPCLPGTTRVLGLDVGTTSIGFALVDLPDREGAKGRIVHSGVRVFGDTRNAQDGLPLNQNRRAARLRRRTLRRRRERMRKLNEILHRTGLLPAYGSQEWVRTMARPPLELRVRALTERLEPHELGRALYHLAQRRHFRQMPSDGDERKRPGGDEERKEKKAMQEREALSGVLDANDWTLARFLLSKADGERIRGIPSYRTVVRAEFDRIWKTQEKLHDLPASLREEVEDAIFHQRPTFWRTSTLGRCPLVPDAPLCPKGSWISARRRLLERVNNLAVAEPARRDLTPGERETVLDLASSSREVTWGAIRKKLKEVASTPEARKEAANLRFNLEDSQKSFRGNPVEASLSKAVGETWATLPARDELRARLHDILFSVRYRSVGRSRVVILPKEDEEERRQVAARELRDGFGLSPEQAEAVATIRLEAGWEPFSSEAVQRILRELEKGIRLGALLVAPDLEAWRNETFPERDRPTGEFHDLLPTPGDRDEAERMRGIRNPTAVRVLNEMRKVVNNLVRTYGKPDLIRVETTRDIGLSAEERKEKANGMSRRADQRDAAREAIREELGIVDAGADRIEKRMLWEECGGICLYTGSLIGMAALMRDGDFEVEHVVPHSRCFNDGFANKTLCEKTENARKGNRTPFEYLGGDEERWAAFTARVEFARKHHGLPVGKARRLLSTRIPSEISERHLVETGYASRLIVDSLKRLWPDVGPSAPVRVQSVSGKVTAYVRKDLRLDGILSDTGVKTRDDHRHHAVDAIVVALCGPATTQALSRHWQAGGRARSPGAGLVVPEPWPGFLGEAGASVAGIVVSHRTQKKLSGSLHKGTRFGMTPDGRTTLRCPVDGLKPKDFARIEPAEVREAVMSWKSAGAKGLPSLGGRPIRRVRLVMKAGQSVLVRNGNGYSDSDGNHHMALYREPDGKLRPRLVSMIEARSNASGGRSPVISCQDGERLLMSLSKGEIVHIETGGTRTHLVVIGVSEGNVTLLDHADARPAKTRRRIQKSIGSLWKDGYRKVAVDPIGRVRAGGR